MKKLLAAAFLLSASVSAIAAEPMVSAADPRAAAAGIEVLKQGGTAADAAVAVMAALGVVEPGHSGVGGGGFLVYYDAKTRKISTYNAREAAPMAADGNWFLDADGKPLPFRDAINSGHSVGVPGELRLMEAAHRDHGKLKWPALFQPAIGYARDGWAITPRFYNFVSRMPASFFTPWATGYLKNADGTAKPVGTVLKNPDIADLYAKIASIGPRYFYTGPVAQNIVTTVNRSARYPSKMTAGDLSTYSARDGAPVCGTYRGYKICGMGAPASGGVIVLEILKQLERFDMAKLGKDSPVAWHLFAESSRLAYADRDTWLGDPEYVQVPIAGLLAKDYIAKRSALISENSTMASVEPGMPAGAPKRVRADLQPEHGTSSLTVVDAAGNVAQATVTIESVFGSGLTTNGIFLNNELTDFDFFPVKDGYRAANRVEGGKRPRSSMSPTIVYDPQGKVRLSIGAAGGSTIIAQIAKAIIGVVDWKLSAQDAISLGLLFAPTLNAVAEKGTEREAMVPALRALGERVVVAPLGLKANAIEFVGGTTRGAADPRSEGVSMGLDGKAIKPKPIGDQVNRPSE